MSTSVAAPAPAPAGAGLAARQPGAARNALATLAILVITGAVILAAAYLSNPAAGDTTGNGDFTAVTVDGQAVGAAPIVDFLAPDFIAVTADGTEFQLSALRGKPVWLTFGASWCQPCRAENPDIMATYVANQDSIAVVQVYMDEDAATVTDYTSRVGITYMTVPDPNERLAAQYRILGIPSHFFIDAQGVLRQVKVGSLDPTTMQSAIEQLRQ